MITNTFKCNCFASFTGPNCNNPLIPIASTPCASNPCNIYQSCQSNGNSYTCSCPSLYTGSSCEIKIRACTSNPCFNNSVCIDNLASGNYTCLCPVGLTGNYYLII